MITQKQREMLEIMKNNLNKADDFYKPSNVLWDKLSTHFETMLKSQGITDVQSQQYNRSFSLFDEQASHILYFKFAMWLLYQNIMKRDKFSLLNKTEALLTNNPNLNFNSASISGRLISMNNKNLNWDYLISIDTILNIAEIYPEIITDMCVVGELGAGWGRIPYYLLQINKSISYNVFDIPQTLLISQEYLKENSQSKIYDYEHNSKINNFDKEFLIKEPGIRFNLSCDIEKYTNKSIDVFISVASFQEMSLNQVKSYFDIIGNKTNYFYIQQRYQDLEMNYSKYPNIENWNVLFDRDITFYPLWFEKMFKC